MVLNSDRTLDITPLVQDANAWARAFCARYTEKFHPDDLEATNILLTAIPDLVSGFEASGQDEGSSFDWADGATVWTATFLLQVVSGVVVQLLTRARRKRSIFGTKRKSQKITLTEREHVRIETEVCKNVKGGGKVYQWGGAKLYH